MPQVEWTQEYHVPGLAPKRIEEDHEARYAFACQFVKGKTVLDLACGVGYGAAALARSGASAVDGVDISKKLIDYARSTYLSDNIEFFAGDICEFDRGKKYDVIACFETIEHVSDYVAAVKNLYRLLNDGGLLLISSPNRRVTSPRIKSLNGRPTNNPFHVQEFTVKELASVLQEQHFLVERNQMYGQRQRVLFRIGLLDGLYRRLLRPDITSSPCVRPLRWCLAPRYFVIVAGKRPTF